MMFKEYVTKRFPQPHCRMDKSAEYQR